MWSNQANKQLKATKSALLQVEKLDKKLNRKKKEVKLVDHVLNEEDLKLWVETPNSLLNKSKADKMKEVIILMAFLGLRVSEAINFDWTKQLKLQKHYCFSLVGKGQKTRRVFNVFQNDYINLKMEAVRANQNLFSSNQFKLTREGVYDHLKRKAQKLSWSWVPTPHDFRRCFATRLLYEKQINPLALKDLLGHSFYLTTEKYIKKDPRNLEYLLSKNGIL